MPCYLINNSLLKEDLLTKINNSDPAKANAIDNLLNYFDKTNTFSSLSKLSKQEYDKQLQSEKILLEIKLNAAYVYLKENPNSDARDVLENTISLVETQVQSSSTPLETLKASNELLSENNQYFKIVVAYEARQNLYGDLQDFANQLAISIPQSQSSNNVAQDELLGLAQTTANLRALPNNDSLDVIGSASTLVSMQLRLASAKQAINAEQTKISEAARIESERLAIEAKAKAEADAKKVAELAEFAKNQPSISFRHIVIDISDQTMYRLEGETVLDSTDVVTGMLYYETPPGTYAIYQKKRNTYLNSPFPGISYSVFVNYWMPFYSGYGIHDAPWRSAFGGDIYTYNGSHGCANTPPAYAALLWDWADVGTTVTVRN